MYIDDLENIHKDGIAMMSNIRRVIRGIPKLRGFKQPVRVVKKTPRIYIRLHTVFTADRLGFSSPRLR